MSTDQIIGERINQIMFRKRVRQTQMSQRMGITQSALSKKLHGDRPWTTEEVFLAAYLLKSPIDEILPPMAELLPHLDSNQKPFDYLTGGDDYPSGGVSLPLAA